jgi:small-conductance mechanosensitive channel
MGGDGVIGDVLLDLGVPWRVLASVVGAVIVLAAAHAVGRLLRRMVRRDVADPRAALFRSVVYYLCMSVGVIAALREFGVEPTSLLVTGGLVTVAVGFASQTSLANIISGIFLAADEPFKVGDAIRVGDIEGVVMSVDLLSTRLRTFDNLYVRVPNETLLKANIVNITHFSVRRADVLFEVRLDADLDTARAVMLEAAGEVPAVLVDPEPVVLVRTMGALTASLELRAWVKTEQYIQARDALFSAIHARLRARGVELGTEFPIGREPA